MSINAIGLQAYTNALRNFQHTESAMRDATRGKSQAFAHTLDQTLVRDTVDRAEQFGAHADFIKQTATVGTPAAHPNSFTDTVAQSLKRVHSLQTEKAMAIDEFASGRSQNVHELMITLQKAGLAMSLTSAVRGKVLEAYKELSRMQF